MVHTEEPYFGHNNVLQLVLQKMETRTNEGLSVLHVAAAAGHVEVVQLLIDCGADIHIADTRHGMTPLHHAARGGHREVVQLLVLDHSADINLADTGQMGMTPLHYAAGSGELEMVRFLVLDRGADMHSVDQWWGRTALHYAAGCGHPAVVQFFLDRMQAAADARNRMTPLHYAADRGHLEVVRQLLAADRGVVRLADTYGRTPLQCAARKDYPQVVQFIVDSVVHTGEELAMAPLRDAIDNGNLEVVQVLLDRGADVNCADPEDGKTPLHHAAMGGRHEVVQLLMHRGAAINIADSPCGRTPLHYAAARGHLEVVRLLAVDIPTVSDMWSGMTPLHCAAAGGHLEVVRYLVVDRGADIHDAVSGRWSGMSRPHLVL